MRTTIKTILKPIQTVSRRFLEHQAHERSSEKRLATVLTLPAQMLASIAVFWTIPSSSYEVKLEQFFNIKKSKNAKGLQHPGFPGRLFQTIKMKTWTFRYIHQCILEYTKWLMYAPVSCPFAAVSSLQYKIVLDWILRNKSFDSEITVSSSREYCFFKQPIMRFSLRNDRQSKKGEFENNSMYFRNFWIILHFTFMME